MPSRQEEKPQKPTTASWLVAPFLWLEWACRWIAYALDNLAVFRVLEFLGKTIVVVGVVIWIFSRIYPVSGRGQAEIWGAWSAVNSKGGGRRDALEYLYRNKVDLLGLYGEGGFFQDIDLHGADLQWANLVGSNFERANLQNADLQSARLDGADLSGANLSGANLIDARLNGANLTGAHLDGANLYRAFLNRTVLLNATLEGANLGGAQLNGANISHADLNRADLNGAILYRADVSNANLNDANLFGANLSDASMIAASLKNAKMMGAKLVAADLSQVSDLTQPQIDSCLGNTYTRLPPGVVMPQSWQRH
ncbi:MAG: pentapeptide repeat-containing protein [Candidatus Binatus sp.]